MSRSGGLPLDDEHIDCLQKNEHEGDKIFNIEKSAFCYSKAAKYESLMSSEISQLIKLIPKYIN